MIETLHSELQQLPLLLLLLEQGTLQRRLEQLALQLRRPRLPQWQLASGQKAKALQCDLCRISFWSVGTA